MSMFYQFSKISATETVDLKWEFRTNSRDDPFLIGFALSKWIAMPRKTQSEAVLYSYCGTWNSKSSEGVWEQNFSKFNQIFCEPAKHDKPWRVSTFCHFLFTSTVLWSMLPFQSLIIGSNAFLEFRRLHHLLLLGHVNKELLLILKIKYGNIVQQLKQILWLIAPLCCCGHLQWVQNVGFQSILWFACRNCFLGIRLLVLKYRSYLLVIARGAHNRIPHVWLGIERMLQRRH